MNRVFKTFSIALISTLVFVSCGDTTPPEDPKPDNGAYTGIVSVAPGTADAFTLEDIEVKFTPAEEGTAANIEMLRVKFAQAMPILLDVLVEGVVLTPATNGYTISCSAEGIVPTAMEGRPFPDHIMTEITGRVTTGTLSFDMVCGEFPMSFTGTKKAE